MFPLSGSGGQRGFPPTLPVLAFDIQSAKDFHHQFPVEPPTAQVAGQPPPEGPGVQALQTSGSLPGQSQGQRPFIRGALSEDLPDDVGGDALASELRLQGSPTPWPEGGSVLHPEPGEGVIIHQPGPTEPLEFRLHRGGVKSFLAEIIADLPFAPRAVAQEPEGGFVGLFQTIPLLQLSDLLVGEHLARPQPGGLQGRQDEGPAAVQIHRYPAAL
jgi:hypothetical protein